MPVVLHPVSVPGTLAAGQPVLFGGLRPLVGPFDPPPVRLEGPPALLAEAAEGLPEGEARPEAIAVRLRRRGVELDLGAPEPLDAAAFVRWSELRGRSSVALWRADPTLLTELQLGRVPPRDDLRARGPPRADDFKAPRRAPCGPGAEGARRRRVLARRALDGHRSASGGG